jgi:prophage regulatory protein
MASPLRLLRLPEVLSRRGRTRSSHYADIARGVFLPPVHLDGARCALWPEHEVEIMLCAVIAGSSENDLRQLVQKLVSGRALRQGHPGDVPTRLPGAEGDVGQAQVLVP